MSDYYEEGKPFSNENWKDLVDDINELIENPLGGNCDHVEPLEEVEEDHVWTLKDVEDVREKLIEMCSENEFEEDLDKPWHKEIIDEIENKMRWCNCGPAQWDIHEHHLTIGDCCGLEYGPCPKQEAISLQAIVDGMEVVPPGREDRRWSITRYYVESDGETIIREPSWRRPLVISRGDITCEGTVDTSAGGGMFVPADPVVYSYFCDSEGFPEPQSAYDRKVEEVESGRYYKYILGATRFGPVCEPEEEEG
jgi:hypothetical protein